ncbi:MAG: hypothetical protein QOF84_5123, partial [Streptomyces sp.]|nr:hypothetical protein [Streptomyces sp.]
MTVSPSVGAHRAATGTDEDSDSRYADDIHRYAARRLGIEAADDLMAETFVIAFQQRRRYDLSRP